MSRFRNMCEKCHRVYSLDSSSSSKLCTSCDDDLKAQRSAIPNGTCKSCHEPFYSPNHLKICPFCHKLGYDNKFSVPKVYDNRKEKKKPNFKPIPYEELVRRMEYKRIFDDRGWDHYLSGKKHDKV